MEYKKLAESMSDSAKIARYFGERILLTSGSEAIKDLLSTVEELEAKNKRLQGQVENANVARSKWEWLYHTEADKNRYLVTECCPHCDTESTLMWSVEEHGYEIYCPVCGKKIMLCSDCGHHNDCDWTEESGCKMKKEEYHE